MKGWRNVFRCKECGKVYPDEIPYICIKCGAKISKPTPTIIQILGGGTVCLTDKCEKVVARKGIIGWKIRQETEKLQDIEAEEEMI